MIKVVKVFQKMHKNRKKIKWVTNGNVTTGITNKGDEFVIDTEDLPLVSEFCWRIDKYGYVVSNRCDTSNTIQKIHNLIMKPPVGYMTDHKNRIKTDNRKSNLRLATKSQNNMNIKTKSNNTSGRTGVKRNPNKTKWVAQITAFGKRIHLGTFVLFDDAVKAREEAEIKYHGEFRGSLANEVF